MVVELPSRYRPGLPHSHETGDMTIEDGTKYLLVTYTSNGEPRINLGGGSSTPSQPRIYETLKMARRYAKRYGAAIVALELDLPNLHIREVEDDDDR
ncbi:hypothetical protein L3Y19_gp109 [Gordonia phage Neville]|uniref:Uncharacterized protein n=2 Tax=Nevillevirus TaxID=3044773 RepID=A0A515MH49_9CAUD|nr:hypothetical protein L3Y19_gp109 [Gordonia phage Neville]YP_010246100.1 hypothetical protein L3Y20_gp110 [Gordonia phage Trax]AXQ64477.1 hypothetical protein SEA_NEVILLE_121 [Gordonia phage Neville]QDM56002.1 hypothetical protein SEA_TRAX_122 [Gordonia phage Trax]